MTNGFISLVLTESIFPPVFGRRLQAQVAKVGGHVLLEVEVSGIPEPVVSWFKDGIPLEVDVNHSQGSIHALVFDEGITEFDNTQCLAIESLLIDQSSSKTLVQPGDAGKYSVRAVNAGGEAESIADLVVTESTPDRIFEVSKTVTFNNTPNGYHQVNTRSFSTLFYAINIIRHNYLWKRSFLIIAEKIFNF